MRRSLVRFCLLVMAAVVTTPTVALAQNTSAFTALDLDACESLSAPTGDLANNDGHTEDGGHTEDEMVDNSWRGKCPGYGAIPIYASEDDLRVDLDAGVPNDRFETPWFFNLPHSTVEWRLDAAGVPFALIHRFWSDGLENRRSMLGVSKIGRPGAPGCMVAMIDGSVPDANARATALADAILDRVQCSDLDTYLIIE